ncbi:MAG: DUF6314 family protein [Candidatus Symbiodolus clandestinus]
MPLKIIFDNWVGYWTWNRHIESSMPLMVPAGWVRGRAYFTVHQDGLHYHEQGEWFTDNGLVYAIQRDYYYRYDPIQERILYWAVNPLGRIECLQVLTLQPAVAGSSEQQLSCQAVCGDDYYQATYTFPGNNLFTQFRLRYQVSGPKKAYCVTSYFYRCN